MRTLSYNKIYKINEGMIKLVSDQLTGQQLLRNSHWRETTDINLSCTKLLAAQSNDIQTARNSR